MAESVNTTTDEAPRNFDDPLVVVTRRLIRARIHISDHEEFIHSVVIDRNKGEYPDPFLRNINDEELLKRYFQRIRAAIKAYTPENEDEKRQCREFIQRERQRVNAQRGRIRFPSATALNIGDIVERTMCLRTGYKFADRCIPWETLETLYEWPLRDLRRLSAYFFIQRNTDYTSLTKKARIINAIRLVRGDPTVDIQNVIEFVPVEEFLDTHSVRVDGESLDLDEGLSFSTIQTELKRIADYVSGLIPALAFAQIGEVTNYTHEKISAGSHGPLRMHIGRDMDMVDKETTGRRNVVAHEYFHAVQEVLGAKDINAADDRVVFDAAPPEWEEIIFFPVEREQVLQIQQQMQELWFRFRSGDFKPLCEYQTKNIHEFFAVAFECLFEHPEVLQEKQPSVYDLLTDITTEQHSTKPENPNKHRVV